MRDRLNRIVLVVRCFVAALVRGRAVRVPRDPRTVIVVLTGKLGDVVCGTPVLRALRARLPQARIVVAGGAVLRAVLADSGLVDEYLDIDSPGAVQRIRAQGADAALVTGPSFVPAALLYLAGIPLVVAPRVTGGHSSGETLPYRLLKLLLATFPYAMGEYAPRERLRALEPLGIVWEDTAKQLGYSAAAKRAADDFFAQHALTEKDFMVGVSPSAGNTIKEWPTERFAEVINFLTKKYNAKVVLFGVQREKARVEKVLAACLQPERVLSTQGNLTLDELKALIARLNLFIAVDTGPIYIAEACKVPTVDIVGPMDEREQPPRGPLNRIVVPPSRARPELHILNARGYNLVEAKRQTLSIEVQAVTQEIEWLIDELRVHKNS